MATDSFIKIEMYLKLQINFIQNNSNIDVNISIFQYVTIHKV